jgi:hypothetical protein
MTPAPVLSRSSLTRLAFTSIRDSERNYRILSGIVEGAD